MKIQQTVQSLILGQRRKNGRTCSTTAQFLLREELLQVFSRETIFCDNNAQFTRKQAYVVTKLAAQTMNMEAARSSETSCNCLETLMASQPKDNTAVISSNLESEELCSSAQN
jgi:hypothetical protein